MTPDEIEAALLAEVDAAQSIYDVDAAINSWLRRTVILERGNMKILIVEDDPKVAKFLIAAAESRGYQTKHRATLFAAKQEITWCDAVLCDGTFPTEEGGKPERNWKPMWECAERYQRGFVLLTGDLDVIKQANADGMVQSLAKLARNIEIFAALIASVERLR